MFEHIDVLTMGKWQQPQTVLPTLLGSDFVVLGHLGSQNDVISVMVEADSHLKLLPVSTSYI
jgi:hypothetical protein